LRRGHVIGNIINARGTIKGGNDRSDNVVNMDAAENLVGHVDAMRLAFCHPLQRRSARAVNAGQAENTDIVAQCLPCKVSFGPRGAPPAAYWRTFINPCAAGIAIDAGGGQIANPCRLARGNRRTIFQKHRIAALAHGRYARQYMRRGLQRGQDRDFIIKGNGIATAHPLCTRDQPTIGAQTVGKAGGGVAHSKYKHMSLHIGWFAI